MGEPDGYREYVLACSAGLLRTAILLTGEEAMAQDLVQATLVKVWPRWTRLTRTETPDPYVRKVMLSIFLTWRRRRWRGELPSGAIPDQASARDAFADVDLKLAVRSALRSLPPRQRATIVLRYLDDLTEAETATLLRCSVGTVKSQTAKALARLRDAPQILALLREVEANHDTT